MDRLSAFKPFQQLVLPPLGELNCSGLIVDVGPNSSGKTQLLQDLYLRLVVGFGHDIGGIETQE